MNDDDFDNKVYSALNKKLLPEFDLDEPKDLGYYVGTTVLILLLVIGIATIVEAYNQQQTNQILELNK